MIKWYSNKHVDIYFDDVPRVGVRYIFRVLTGKREMAPSDTMQMVAMRKSLYQQFEIFDKK